MQLSVLSKFLVLYLCVFLVAAATQISLTGNQIIGILPVANGGDGVTTAAAGTVLAGPSSGSGAYSFRTLIINDSGTIANYRHWSYHAKGGIVGDDLNSVANAAADNAATSTLPNNLSRATSTVSGNVASLSGNNNWGTGRNAIVQWYVAFDSTANTRWAIALSDLATATHMAGDTPAGSWVEFRYSSGVPDTNYQCGASKAGVSAFIDSGIAADTNYHRFEINFNDSVPNVTYLIDGVVVCTQSDTTKIPATVVMKELHGITTLTTAAKTLREVTHFVEADF